MEWISRELKFLKSLLPLLREMRKRKRKRVHRCIMLGSNASLALPCQRVKRSQAALPFRLRKKIRAQRSSLCYRLSTHLYPTWTYPHDSPSDKNDGDEEMEMKMKKLGALIPGGRLLTDSEDLLSEAAHYILSLRLKLYSMQLLYIITGCDSEQRGDENPTVSRHTKQV